MKDIKTTILGFLAGLAFGIEPLITAYNAGYFDGKTGSQVLFAIAIILLGRYAAVSKPSATVSADDIGGGGIKNPPKP
jgi:hypothetical protein